MDFQYEDVYIGEPLDDEALAAPSSVRAEPTSLSGSRSPAVAASARVPNSAISQSNARRRQELRQRSSELQQGIVRKRKKSSPPQSLVSDVLHETRMQKLVKRLVREVQELRANAHKQDDAIQTLRRDLEKQAEDIRSGRATSMRVSGTESSLNFQGSSVDENDQSTLVIGHNGNQIRHCEHEEPVMKQEINEDEIPDDGLLDDDSDHHDHELHDLETASEFEGFDEDSQDGEPYQNIQTAQRERRGQQTESGEGVYADEESDTANGHPLEANGRLRLNIDDVSVVVEADEGFSLVLGQTPEALEPDLDTLLNETFPAEMEAFKVKNSRRGDPTKKKFRKHWKDQVKHTSGCVRQFLTVAGATHAIDDRSFITCRTCFRAQLPCIRWDSQGRQFYVCLLPKVSRKSGGSVTAGDYIYPEKNMSGELEEEHGALWAHK